MKGRRHILHACLIATGCLIPLVVGSVALHPDQVFYTTTVAAITGAVCFGLGLLLGSDPNEEDEDA